MTAEREETEEVSNDRFDRFERRLGWFSRAVSLPQGVDEGKINVAYRDGVLEVWVPKPEVQKPRKIVLSNAVESPPTSS